MTTRTEMVAKLKLEPLFSGLGAPEVEALASIVHLRTYPKGAFVLNQNERGSSMYVLASGRVKLSLASPDGKELALDYLDAPAHFGEMSVVENGQHAADVIAMSDIEVFVFEARDLTEAIRIQPALATKLIATLASRLAHTIERLEGMAFHDATHRVMRVLLNIATASYESRGAPVIQGITHYDIATLAGTSRETASRIISSLQRDGVVATKGRRIVVDLIGLRERLDAD